MTPAFALDLALDGIRLLYRADGGWTVVGDVALDAPDLDTRLAALRADAEALAPGAVRTELIIPASQIRYTEISRDPGEPVTEATLRPKLDGLTPLTPEALVFDWEVEGDAIRLAILDRTTLNEAEAFADAHGFNPVCFSARPSDGEFPRDPDFGATSVSSDFDEADGGASGAFTSARTHRQEAPEATRESPPDDETTAGAAELARSLAGPSRSETEKDKLTVFGQRGKLPFGADDRARETRLKIAAGVGLAAIVWLAYFSIRSDGPSDPAAVLPDTPPAVALDAPGLDTPETDDLAVTTSPGVTDPAPALPPAQPGVAEATPESVENLEPAVTTPPEEMTDEDPALRYAATGIWAEGPDATRSPGRGPADTADLYIASIDPITRSNDAIALPGAASLRATPRPVTPLPPPPAGTTFDFDESGLVRATPEGAWTPEGIVVSLGSPALVPPPAPARTAELGLPLSETAAALPDRRPLPRPTGLLESNERANLGGLTRNELARVRPAPRPQSAQATAMAALAADAAPSDLAVAASIAPRDRPENFATNVATQRAVAAALAQSTSRASDDTPEADDEPDLPVASAAPNIPTSASVARQATMENAMRLRDLNLIGVYGSEGNRRALVRLPSGRYVKVQVGDRLDGGQIAAISRNALRYIKGGRNITLTVPSG